MFTTLYIEFSDAQGQLTGILSKFELIRSLMHFLVTCKNEEDPSKGVGARVSQDFFYYKSMGIFPDAQGQLTPQSMGELGRIPNSFEI